MVPFEVKLTGTVPLTAPAVPVLVLPPRPTVMAVLAGAPTRRSVTDPLALADPVAVPGAASRPSVKFTPPVPALLMLTGVVPKVPPTCTLPSVTGVVIVFGAAYANTPPVTLIVWPVNPVEANPSIVPFEVKLTGTVPLTAPAVPVLVLPPRPTVMAVLAGAPTRRSVTDPLALADPVAVPGAASRPSVKFTPPVPALLMLTGVVPKVSPTCTLPSETGVVIVFGAA